MIDAKGRGKIKPTKNNKKKQTEYKPKITGKEAYVFLLIRCNALSVVMPR